MPVDWIYGLIGGVMIGLAAAAFLLVNGRVLGVSGIVGGLVDGTGRANRGERLAFVAGLVLAPGLAVLATGGADTHITGQVALIAAGGLLVGIGTRIANGCTSGHGVCGISRLSPQGIAATIVYILAGGAVIATLRHLAGVL